MNISTNTINHPKVIKLKRRMGAEAVLSLFALWAWAEQERPDGILSDLDEEDLAIAAGWDGDDRFFITTLIELRLLDWDGKTFVLSHWPGSNEAQQPRESTSDARSEQARNAARTRWENKKSVASMLSDAEHESAYAPHDAQHMRRINQHDPHVLRSSGVCSSTTTTPDPSSFTPPTAPEIGCNESGSAGCGGGEESGTSGTAGEWEYPASLTPDERQHAETLIREHQDQAQALLDEVAAAINAGKIRSSPIAYLRALVKRASAGAFRPEAGIKIALARERRRETESAVRNAHAKAEQVRHEATARTPIDKDAVKAHIAALRAAMQMPREAA